MSRSRLLALSAALSLGMAMHAHSQAQITTGRAEVVAGDSLEMTGISIRLFGVDAPEASDLSARRPDEVITREREGLVHEVEFVLKPGGATPNPIVRIAPA